MGAVKEALQGVFSDVHSWANNLLTGERDYGRQKELQEIAQQFSANEAQKSRDWQEQLSGTAYQRAAKDLKAAGLNPALLYSSSGQASTPAGATAHGASASAGSSGQGVVPLISNLISGIGGFMLRAQRQAANAEQYRSDRELSERRLDLERAKMERMFSPETVVYADKNGEVVHQSYKTRG